MKNRKREICTSLCRHTIDEVLQDPDASPVDRRLAHAMQMLINAIEIEDITRSQMKSTVQRVTIKLRGIPNNGSS